MPVTPHAAPPPRPVPRPVDPGQPFTWLARGWADLLRQPVPGLLHGLATAVFGALLVALAVSYTHLTLPTSDLGEISVGAVSLKKKHRKHTEPSTRS